MEPKTQNSLFFDRRLKRQSIVLAVHGNPGAVSRGNWRRTKHTEQQIWCHERLHFSFTSSCLDWLSLGSRERYLVMVYPQCSRKSPNIYITEKHANFQGQLNWMFEKLAEASSGWHVNKSVFICFKWLIQCVSGCINSKYCILSMIKSYQQTCPGCTTSTCILCSSEWTSATRIIPDTKASCTKPLKSVQIDSQLSLTNQRKLLLFFSQSEATQNRLFGSRRAFSRAW